MRTRVIFACLAAFFAETAFQTPVAAQSEQPDERFWASPVRALLEESDYESARRWLKNPLRESADPDAAYAYLYCLYKSEAYRRLLTVARTKRFRVAVSQRRGRILVGLTLWRVGDIPGALQAWAAILAADPRDDLAWDCVRVAVASAPRSQRTDLVLGVQRALGSSRFATTFLLGLVESLRGRTAQAEKSLREARLLFPESKTVALALRDLYRHSGNREASQELEAWLTSSRGAEERMGGRRASDKFNNISILQPRFVGAAASSVPYRLPWPDGQAVFCGSHRDRLETPHRNRGEHALDFLLPQGMPVVAARGGIVEDLCDRQKAFANREFVTFILINHDDGTWGRYYHLRGGSLRVRKGQRVPRGAVLAQSGRTGRCQSRHLHFEVLRKARWRPSGPRIYSRWQTIPVDFEETRQLSLDEITGRWLVSRNKSPISR